MLKKTDFLRTSLEFKFIPCFCAHHFYIYLGFQLVRLSQISYLQKHGLVLVIILSKTKLLKIFSMFFRDIRSKTVCKKGVVKSFAKFTGKQLCWSLFSIISGSMQRGLQLYCDSVTCTLTLARVFSCESCEIFKNNFFLKEHLQWLLLTVFLILSLVHLFISVLSYVCFSLNVSGTFIFIQQCSMENGMKIKKLLKTLKNTLKYTYTGKKKKRIPTNLPTKKTFFLIQSNQWTSFYMITASVMKGLRKGSN